MNRLYTIPISHYCERARWALDRGKVPYQEIRHLQGFHYFSSYYHAFSPTVPILKTKEGTFKNSDDILMWANQKMELPVRIYPEDSTKTLQIVELEKYYTEILGPAGRLWMYTFMLKEMKTVQKYSKMHGLPGWEVALMPVVFPLVKNFLRKRLREKPESRSLSKKGVEAIFNQTATFLEDGRSLHMGDRFSAADLTFASMAAAVLLPENYGVTLPKLDELPAEMADQIYQWRQHPAGQFALRIFRDHRNLVSRS
jgi:glutathione S-transferase